MPGPISPSSNPTSSTKSSPATATPAFFSPPAIPNTSPKKPSTPIPKTASLLSAENPWYLSGTPAEIFQAIALFALGLDVTLIDRVALLALDSPTENIFSPFRPFRFEITSSFEAKQFLETQPLQALRPLLHRHQHRPALPPLHAPPAAGPSPVFTFTEDNLTEFPRWDRQPVINEAVWRFDKTADGYANYETFIQASSVSQYGRGNQFSVQSDGLRAQLGAFAFTDWLSERLFRRFAGVAPGIKGGAPLLTLRAFLLTLPVWVGDYIALTHTKMPDITTGNLGVTNRIFEVIDRQPDYSRALMTYKLLDTGLTGLPAAYQWGTNPARPFLLSSSPLY